MAGSTGPPKSKRSPGRPKGSVDKSRDYPLAVRKMLALRAKKVSERGAAEAVGLELNIPANTLRTHLRNAPKEAPRRRVHPALAGLERAIQAAEEIAKPARQAAAEQLQRQAQQVTEIQAAQIRQFLSAFPGGIPPPKPRKKPK